ncbi:MAG TPA: metallophosphoesterase family protein [Planctomycetota bacterium]|jgi:diadenosine tetraphosphatase ApaH/serine/threonine PP2A family protein phosphatase|nr:metallophosphoesterase family protein [Planctomycetota bacterium]
MRYGILGDIHANSSALEAVLASIAREGVDRFVSVGDIAGYGADPVGCVERVIELGALTVAGNHDLAVIGRLPLEYFNPLAKEAILWTRSALSAQHGAFFGGLPLLAEEGPITVAHGSIARPEAFEYIQTAGDAQASLERLRTRVGFVGHSHVPVSFLYRDGAPLRVWYTFDQEVSLRGYSRALVNVGSIGQPRDGDPRAAYAIYDDAADAVWIRRVPYDVDREDERIRRSGLPGALADRLRLGI